MERVKAADWQRPAAVATKEVRNVVREVIERIEREGDDAIADYSLRFDQKEPELIPLKPWQDYDLTEDVRKHLLIAAGRIEGFAKLQMSMYRDVSHSDRFGSFGQRVLPLDRMAAYVPGGRFPLVSTALMTLIPARVAGVPERICVSPTDHPAVLAAASLAGASAFLRLGGAQAIAAAALGCSWMAPVDMVVGPGNAYVNEAKALLQDRVKIDSLAGPSEILMLCDETADPAWVALDVLAQAEHDPMALSVLGSTSETLLDAVAAQIETYAAQYPDKDTGIIQLVHCKDGSELVGLSNLMAPEHLHVMVGEGVLNTDELRHYGSLFVGGRSAVALGDYCSGPNHTLPTLAGGRFKGGLNVGDFLKVLTWQKVGDEHYNEIADTGICLAGVEDLLFHKMSLEVRRT